MSQDQEAAEKYARAGVAEQGNIPPMPLFGLLEDAFKAGASHGRKAGVEWAIEVFLDNDYDEAIAILRASEAKK
jgi:hypothetical protein